MIINHDQKSYTDPRISLNKLAEYLTTTKASRRERILQDAKYPPTFQVIRYDPTRALIQRYLSGKISSMKELFGAIADYSMTFTKDDFEARMKKSNLEAMEHFADSAPNLGFGDAKVTMGQNAPKRRNVLGVSISVRPDLNLSVVGGNVATRRGAIKLNISKGAVHGKEAAEYVGTLLRRYVDEESLAGECDHQLCFSFDVFGKKLVPSPKAVVNRMKDIEAGCGEIARQWSSVTPG